MKNIDRLSGSNNFIYPFITKDGSLQSFATVSTTAFNSRLHLEMKSQDLIQCLHPCIETIMQKMQTDTFRRTAEHDESLQDNLSPHYEYSGEERNDQELNLISIPSIFYGSRIKRGTMDLKFYITGTLIGQLQDINKNGELIQVAPSGSTGSGSVLV